MPCSGLRRLVRTLVAPIGCGTQFQPSPLEFDIMTAYETRTVTVDGRTFIASFYVDEGHDAPWDAEDGHGPVSDWTSREKRSGERVLCSDRSSRRFYDWQAACKLARSDGWDTAPYDAPNRIERVVQADFDRLQAWCNDEWYWCGIAVQATDNDGEPIGDKYAHTVWGIESDADDYFSEVIADLISEVIASEERATFPVL
jgi:hypothetical protein